jgi:hypothetical protein
MSTNSVGQGGSVAIIEPNRRDYQSGNTYADNVDSCCALTNDSLKAGVDYYVNPERKVARDAAYRSVDSLTDCSAGCLKKVGGADDSGAVKEDKPEEKKEDSSWWKVW